MIARLLIASLLVASVAHADPCPAGEGEWTAADGSVGCRPCVGALDYGETTPMPRGCVVLAQGILWTVVADAAVAGELAQQSAQTVELRAVSEDVTARLVEAHVRCAEDLEIMASQRPSWVGVMTWFAAGVVIGASGVSFLSR